MAGVSTDASWHDASFRDPNGRVVTQGDRLLRALHLDYAKHYDALLASGLYRRLTEARLLIPHREVAADTIPVPRDFAIHTLIEPERIGFVSYPYEWPFSALRDAALVTLRVQRLAIEHGMTLKDASAFNVQWHRGLPLLIDTSSFEVMATPRPWHAYRQFCRHFLAPLALMSHVDARLLGLWLSNLDGLPLDLASRLLPRPTWLRPGLLFHLHLHARGEHALSGSLADTAQPKVERTTSRAGLLAVIDSLEKATRSLRYAAPRTAWSRYGDAPPSYNEAAGSAKAATVERVVRDLRPELVWDLGANTGNLSRIALRAGAAQVVALEHDHASSERCYRETRADDELGVLPLISDLMNPSPALGWAQRERSSLSTRGQADLALVLALLHHLAIASNVPLPRIAAWLAEVAKAVLIEWVPKSDAMVRHLLRSRDDVFADYHEAAFADAFAQHFDLVERDPIAGSERVLYLYRRR